MAGPQLFAGCWSEASVSCYKACSTGLLEGPQKMVLCFLGSSGPWGAGKKPHCHPSWPGLRGPASVVLRCHTVHQRLVITSSPIKASRIVHPFLTGPRPVVCVVACVCVSPSCVLFVNPAQCSHTTCGLRPAISPHITP